MMEWQRRACLELQGIQVDSDVPMARLTTFKIGGPADLLARPGTIQELEKVARFCDREKLPWMVLGLGSNLLVRDRGIRGVVIMLDGGEFAEWSVEGCRVTAGAAMPIGDLAKAVSGRGLCGLEFACGIPGSVGGAVYMNAGAYGGEISQVLEQAYVWDLKGGLTRLLRGDFDFSYRHSCFQSSGQVIVKLVFKLQSGSIAESCAQVEDFTQKRECKQPLEMPSAGSMFRRPEGYFVGPLIEAAGLKGFSIGGAQVSLKHAGFIVNTGNATAKDVLDLIAHIRAVVKERNGVDLIPEVKIVGEE